jgi:hypothetical protein
MKLETTKLSTALVATCLTLGVNQAYAQNNDPPPAGPVILDLNGTPVPHAQTQYTTSFTATSANSDISFAFREDPAFLELSDVIVTTGGGPNLILNGTFSGPLGAPAPTDWTYLNTFGATFGGQDDAGCGAGGTNCYFDGAVQAYDSITQAIATTIGQTYNISFFLDDTGGLTTFSALSTNGQPGTSGNGIDLLVYGGATIPVAATPLPSSWTMLLAALVGLGLIGLSKKRNDFSPI